MKQLHPDAAEDLCACGLIDMHAHPADRHDLPLCKREVLFRKQHNITTFFSCGTPEEWTFSRQLLTQWKRAKEALPPEPSFLLSFGIHPWQSDKWDCADWMALYEEADCIGEIGMDDLWCSVPLGRQKKILEQQLQIAADLKKPVVLHTKNQEAAIAAMLKDFPQPVLVHWFSGDQAALDAYLQLDCYFTFAPDVAAYYRSKGQTVTAPQDRQRMERMLREVPFNRLFSETDGLESILWAGYPHTKCTGDRAFPLLPAVLSDTVRAIAEAKETTPADVAAQMRRNLSDFLAG